MLIAIALIAFALIAHAIEEGWIAPQVGLGGFVAAAILLAAGMFETRRFPARDNAPGDGQTAPGDGNAPPVEKDARPEDGKPTPGDKARGVAPSPAAPQLLALPPRRAARMREMDP